MSDIERLAERLVHTCILSAIVVLRHRWPHLILTSTCMVLRFRSPVLIQGLRLVKGLFKVSEPRYELHLPGTPGDLLRDAILPVSVL